MIPQALAPLARYRQFITYNLSPRKDHPEKIDKKPSDWRNGIPHDFRDHAIYTDYDTAYGSGSGRVAFVLTEADPFWFLDIDGCLVDGAWSPLALECIAMLPGAAVEVSVSGTGLHIVGTGSIPDHACRGPAGSGLEFYHTGRIMALGGREGSQGSADVDCTAGVAALVAKYFPVSAPDSPRPEWTTGPCAEWRGSKDDDDLIRRMFASPLSSAGAFGSRASIPKLWEADSDALHDIYPDLVNGRPYDCSTADAALAQHLAFWTGNDCARMQRLMERSGLKRDKWTEHKSYMARTITEAVRLSTKVCQDKEGVTDGAGIVSNNGFLDLENTKKLFEGACYVTDMNKIIMPGGLTYTQDRFDSTFGMYRYPMDKDNVKTTSSAWECFTKNTAAPLLRAYSSNFRPELPPGVIWFEGDRCVVNSYWPIKVGSQKGNARPFLMHLEKILPVYEDRQIILAYMAAVVQYKGVKFRWAPLIQGMKGNGKSLLTTCLKMAIGKSHCHSPKASEIVEKYNDWMLGKIFIAVEDIYVTHDRRDTMEILKPMISETDNEIRGMGRDKFTGYVCCNYWLNSNHKDALKIEADERRYAPFFCAQQRLSDLHRDGMDGTYFKDLFAWLAAGGYAIITDYLKKYPIPDALNPSMMDRAPRTSSTDEAIIESLGSIEQEIMAAISEGRQGFRAGWISSHYLGSLFRDQGIKLARNKRLEIVEGLGYVRHPGLAKGQCHNDVQPDGVKSVLYIKIGHVDSSLQGSDVAKKYTNDQVCVAVNPFRQVTG
jgi:hypothetical protein